jgi:hypothetical protein
VIVQAVAFGFRIAEIGVPTRYHADASSVNFRRSVTYGICTLQTLAAYLLDRSNLRRQNIFRKRLEQVISRYHRELLTGGAHDELNALQSLSFDR